MNRWEYWGKWALKGVLWAIGYTVAAVSLGLEPQWRLLVLVVLCAIWADLLDAMWPTDAATRNAKAPGLTPDR